MHSKRGRLDRFRTRAERDRFLQQEIASIEAHRTVQGKALQTTKQELEVAKTGLREVEEQLKGLEEKGEDSRVRVRELMDEMGKAQEESVMLKEKRKDLWREDAKLETSKTHARDELRTAERTLASMMDKVRGHRLGLQLQLTIWLCRIRAWV